MAIAACKKAFESDATYTITGKMLTDCSGEPLANYGIRLRYKSGGPLDPKESTVLGIDTTDAQGNFTFSNIPVKYKSSLAIFHDISNEDLTIWWSGSVDVRQDGDVVDLGNFYGSHSDVALTKFNIDITKFNSFDTLYIGQGWNNYNYLYPISDNIIFEFGRNYNVPGRANETDSFKIFWGIGRIFYDSLSKNHYQTPDSKYHTFKCRAYTCNVEDTIVFSIP